MDPTPRSVRECLAGSPAHPNSVHPAPSQNSGRALREEQVGGCRRAARLPEKSHLDMEKIMVHVAQPSAYIPVMADGLVHKPGD